LNERIAAKVKNTNASGDAISAAELEFGTTAVVVGLVVLVLLPVLDARVDVEDPVVVVPLLGAVVDEAALLLVELAVAEEREDEIEDATDERDDVRELMDEAIELEAEEADAETDEVAVAPPMSSN
jgi:hypothetical protein